MSIPVAEPELAGVQTPSFSYLPESETNSAGDAIELASAYGLELDEWQRTVLSGGLGEKRDGTWAARHVGLSVARQSGKGVILEARELAGLLLFGEQLMIHSAHLVSTALEGFQRIKGYFENFDDLRKRVKRIREANGEQAVEFLTGQRLMFRARANGVGRGMSPEVLILDEAQILSDKVFNTLQPATSAQPNPQLWLVGTAPQPDDSSEVFSRLRNTAHSGRKSPMAWMEWSAEQGDDLDSPETWVKANPAYGVRIRRDAIESERASMTDDGFRLERLGMWNATGADQWVIPEQFWSQARDLQSKPAERLSLGVEVGPDLSWASVALAGQRNDGLWHVELDERQDGAEWVPAMVRGLLEANPQIRSVVADAGSPSKALFDEFTRQRVRVTKPQVKELGAGCAQLLNGIVAGTIKHPGQGQLDSAVASAGKRALSDTGMWVWNRKTAATDITPIQAATLALMGAQNENVLRPRRASASSAKAVVM